MQPGGAGAPPSRFAITLGSAADRAPRAAAPRGSGGARPSSAAAPEETPVERYHRLVAETEELRSQLQGVTASGAGGGSAGVWAALDSGVADLQRELGGLAGQLHAALSSVASRSGGGGGASEVAPRASAADGGVAAPTAPSSTAAAAAGVLAAAELEGRVAAVEAALGLTGAPAPADGAGAGGGAPSPLGARLGALERQLALLSSPSELAALTARADKAAASLRALSDARAAAQAGLADPTAMVVASGRLARAAEAAEALAALTVQVLPPLTSRLLSLDAVHREAALFTQRLAAVEATSGATARSLEEDAALLREVRAAVDALAARVGGSGGPAGGRR